jgi:AraC-like DNA-binding protein
MKPGAQANKHINIRPITAALIAEKNGEKRSKQYQVFAFESGLGKHEIYRVPYPIQPGTIHVLTPGMYHSITPSTRLRGIHIEFDENFFLENTEHKDILFRLPLVSSDMPSVHFKPGAAQFSQIQYLMSDILQEYKKKKEGYIKIVLSSLNILLVKLARLTKNKKTSRVDTYYTSFQIVYRYKKLIAENAHKEHGVNYYAHQLGYTSNYLNNIVKDVTGQTSKALIYQYLIAEIKRYLLHTKLSHKEIAEELGFSDQSYFTKFFKRETGELPFNWYRTVLKNTNFR